MRLMYYCLFTIIVCGVKGRRITFNEANMPIHLVETTYGPGDHERIEYLEAVIQPKHVKTKGRIDFPRSGYLNDYFNKAKANGDERGHLVASQFSGPAEWYNLSPQNARVNRNKDYQAITTDWYGAECEVRKFLEQGGNNYVNWRVRMKYAKNSNRPNEYQLQVQFIKNGQNNGNGIDTRIRNPLQTEDSSFWICRACRSSGHSSNDQCKRQ